jgi:hypothetical protein
MAVDLPYIYLLARNPKLNQSTHHKTQHFVFTGYSKGINYMYTLWLGSTNFPRTLRPFQKPGCQKSDKKDVHNLNFRHCQGVLVHVLKISWVWLSPHQKLQVDFHHWGHLKCRVHMCFGGCTHWSPDCYYGNNYTWHSECVKICCMIPNICAY